MSKPTLAELRGLRGKRKLFKQTPPMMIIPEEVWGPTLYMLGGRFYTTPEGKLFPSVTTFTGYFEDGAWLEEWRKKVGEAEAERISQRACDRGELVHRVLEMYVMNDPEWDDTLAGKFRFMFNQIRKVLDRKLDAVIYHEHALYSDKLKIAGRVDLCGIWDGMLAIIDFKNKNRLSKKADIDDYFIQACVYAILHAEQYGALPLKLVILLAVEDEGIKECQVMVEDTKDWIPKVIAMARKFHEESPFYNLSPETIAAATTSRQ